MRCLWRSVLVLLALSALGTEARRSKRKPGILQSVSWCAITSPTSGISVSAGSALTVSVSTAGTVLRVDVFLSSSTNSSGCKLLEIPAPSTGGTISAPVNIPSQATGTLYVYAKCKSTVSTDPLVASAYVPISITGGTGGNIPPIVIRLTSPLTTQTFTAPTTIAPAATACDLDGSITKVEFLNGTAKFGTGTTIPYLASPGLYIPTAQNVSFYAVAFDNTGATATSGLLKVSVGGSTSGGGSGGSGGGGSSGSGFSLTVVNGFGSGNKPLYSWVNFTANDPPAGQVFAGWVTTCSGTCPQLRWSEPGGQATYAASVYASSGGSLTATATYQVDPGIPSPVTTHPRLMITKSDLENTLQGWATVSNPMYAYGFKPALTQALNKANSAWSWSFNGGTGAPIPGANWHDTGSDGWEGDQTEAYAMFFAFSALIHKDRTHALRAKDLFMWIIRTADVNGPKKDSSLPFGSPYFATYNRASHYGDGFGATYDWLQWDGFQPPLFATDEKAMIRRVFLMWANAQLTAYMSPSPAGTMNNPVLLTGARDTANNYASAHMRQLAYYALSFNAADDCVVDSKLPEAFVGNTVRSFIYSVAGSWLYNKYAIMESPATVAAAYGIPVTTPNLGSMSGGLSPEGFLYGSSMEFVMQTLAALQTSGWGTVAALGPQMQLTSSTWWDKYLTGFMSQLVPTPFNATGSNAYMGQVWQMFNYGDCLRLFVDPPQFDQFGILGWYDKQTSNPRYKISQWIGANVMLGGSAQLYQRASNIWGNSYARGGILHFLLYNPGFSISLDPRTSLPLTFVDPALGRVAARTSWSTTAMAFAYKCSWENINHQLGDCGLFELYRKGEWLTKENTGYAADSVYIIGESSVLKNTLAIQNTCSDPTLAMPTGLQPDEQGLFSLGSQQAQGYVNGGDPNSTIADNSRYTTVHSSFAGLYNRPNFWYPGSAAVDVQHASRTLLWLKNEEVVVTYDRATTIHSGKFKRWNMNFITQPQQNGNVVTQTRSVNQLQVTTLLPVGANITIKPIPSWNNVAELEPCTHMMTVEDPAGPADVRFLHVLQAADASAPAPTPAVLLTGSVNGGPAGSAQGALVGGLFAAIFKFDATASSAPVTSLSFSLPVGVTPPATIIVTGLVPGAPYSLSGPDAAGAYLVTQSSTGTAADAAGVALF